MARIPDEIIDDIRSRVDIVELISEYLPLKPAGRNFKALCPFHSEKTPSFMVHPEKQIYHCFGCGAGGDVFGFLMAYEKLSYPEAVRRLAERAGVKIPEFKPAERQDAYDNLYRAVRFALGYFRQKLAGGPQGQGARDYLARRGLKAEVIKEFQLGFAPDETEGLIRAAQAAGISLKDLVSTGLALQRRSGSGFVDYFRGRIIFPIFNPGGNPIGFGGRVVETGEPKYLNSPDTSIFHKGRVLYGLWLSKNEIRRRGEAVLVEGYMDLISLYSHGITNVAAGLGTAFTPDQANYLKRYGRRVFLLYDPDEAGKRAAVRTGTVLVESGFEVRMVTLPPGKDPDLFVWDQGADALRQLIDSAPDFIDYLVDGIVKGRDSWTVDQEARLIEELGEVLSLVPDELRRNLYVKKVSDRLALDPSLLIARSSRRRRWSRNKEPVAPPVRSTLTSRQKAERNILKLMLADGSVIEKVRTYLDQSDFSEGIHRQLAGYLLNAHDPAASDSLRAVMARFTEERDQQYIVQLTMDETPDDRSERAIKGLVGAIRRDDLVRRLKAVDSAIRKCKVGSASQCNIDDLLAEKMRLERELKQLQYGL